MTALILTLSAVAIACLIGLGWLLRSAHRELDQALRDLAIERDGRAALKELVKEWPRA